MGILIEANGYAGPKKMKSMHRVRGMIDHRNTSDATKQICTDNDVLLPSVQTAE